MPPLAVSLVGVRVPTLEYESLVGLGRLHIGELGDRPQVSRIGAFPV